MQKELKAVILGLAALIALIAVYFFYLTDSVLFLSNSNEWYLTAIVEKLLFPISGAFLVLVYTLKEVYHALNQRTENAFKLLQQWDEPTLLKARIDLSKLNYNPENGLLVAINSSSDLTNQMILLVSYWLKIYHNFEENDVFHINLQSDLEKSYKIFYERYDVVLRAWCDDQDYERFRKMYYSGFSRG